MLILPAVHVSIRKPTLALLLVLLIYFASQVVFVLSIPGVEKSTGEPLLN